MIGYLWISTNGVCSDMNSDIKVREGNRKFLTNSDKIRGTEKF